MSEPRLFVVSETLSTELKVISQVTVLVSAPSYSTDYCHLDAQIAQLTVERQKEERRAKNQVPKC